MTPWAAKVLADVPRHNAQDAKNMTGYVNAVWLHEDAVVDAIARMGAGDGLVERLLARKGRYGAFKLTVEDGVNVLRHEPVPDPLCQEAAAHIAALTEERRTLRLVIEANIEKHRSRAEAAEAERDALRERVARLEGALTNLPAIYAHQINTGVREVYDPLQRFYTMESVLAALTDGAADE